MQDYARVSFLLLGLPFICLGGWILLKSVTILLNHSLSPVTLVVLAFGLLWTGFYIWLNAICLAGCLPSVLEFDPTRQTVRWQRVPFHTHEYPLAQIDRVELLAGFNSRWFQARVVLLLRNTRLRRRLTLWWIAGTNLAQVTAQAEPIAQVIGKTLGRPVEIISR
ncbi:MAG: hypothetical protein ABFD16_29460 [Thermoguttaceae bacterium]|jgi:hypothetical protein